MRCTLRRLSTYGFILFLLYDLGLPTANAQGLELEALTCLQLAHISPDSVQTTVIGLSVGYAMGKEGASFELEEANAWFDAFRNLCKVAPDAKVSDVMAELPGQISE